MSRLPYWQETKVQRKIFALVGNVQALCEPSTIGLRSRIAEPLYILDTSIKECFAGQVLIPCEKIAKDKDMKPFLEQYLK